MPHHPAGSCSVCSHDQRQTIDVMIVEKTAPLRALAERFGLKKTSLHRHKTNHIERDGRAEARKDDGDNEETLAIDAEIARLRRSQKRAERRRDEDTKLKISKEIRTWLELRAKLRSKRAITSGNGRLEPASRAEALQLAKDIIEMEMTATRRDDVLAWIRGLLERAVATDSATSGMVEVESQPLSV